MNREKEIKKLLERRSGFFKVKAEITRIFEPRIFELGKENTSNVRNTIIISGALATLNFFIFDKSSIYYVPELLIISSLSLIIAIICYSFYLLFVVGNSIHENNEVLNKNVALADKGQEIIEEALDEKISYMDAEKKLISHANEVEYGILRKKDDKPKKKYTKESLLGLSGNTFFVSGLVLMILAFLIPLCR